MQQLELQMRKPTGMNGMSEHPLCLVRHVAYNLPCDKRGNRKDRIHGRVQSAVEWLDRRIPNWRYALCPVENEVIEIESEE
ncbi:MAG: hypothetical protein ACRC8W_09270 [Plesiomonas shigelloides]